jgi:antitoxin MazE
VYTFSVQTKIAKWGNSLGVRIPKALADETAVGEGSRVEILARDGELVLRPLRRPSFTLEELLAGVRKENLHEEVDTGSPEGREIW